MPSPVKATERLPLGFTWGAAETAELFSQGQMWVTI